MQTNTGNSLDLGVRSKNEKNNLLQKQVVSIIWNFNHLCSLLRLMQKVLWPLTICARLTN